MLPSTIRRVLLAVTLLAGFALAGAGCGHHDADDSIAFTVQNLHGQTIFVEGIDSAGFVVDFGTILPGEVVTFSVCDCWTGHTLRARCTCDGTILAVEFAHDGLFWEVF